MLLTLTLINAIFALVHIGLFWSAWYDRRKPKAITLQSSDLEYFTPGMKVECSSSCGDTFYNVDRSRDTGNDRLRGVTTRKRSWVMRQWDTAVCGMTLLLVLVFGSCNCSNGSQEIVGPVDAAPDSAPATQVLTLGQCWTRYHFVEGVCISETDTAECGVESQRVTYKAISQTEHYSGGVVETYSDQCPEKLDFKDFNKTIESNGCTILCAMRFDISQQFAE